MNRLFRQLPAARAAGIRRVVARETSGRARRVIVLAPAGVGAGWR